MPATLTTDTLVPNITGLRCRVCGEPEDLGPTHVCSACFGPLEVVYDEDVVARHATREAIAAGPDNVWRYASMLPVLEEGPVPGPSSLERPDLGAGFTPFVRAPQLAERLGLRELWLKDDTRNPTGSFKDRVVAVALDAARALGIDTLACASTGNLANAVAAHAAKAGMPSFVLIPHDLEEAKIVTSAIYGTNVIAVVGNYDQVNRLCAEIADTQGWGFVNVNLRAYYAEGSKTLGFEVAEQLGRHAGSGPDAGWELPDHVVVPIASGAQLVKVDKSFGEVTRYGLVSGIGSGAGDDHGVRISGAQAAGCGPVATAFEEGSDDIRPVKPDTIAKSLAIGDPADGWFALQAVRRTEGSIAAVTDEQIRDGIRLLAETEGIFAETAGGVTIATLAELARRGDIGPDERVVALVTGHGLKTVEALTGHVGPTRTIEPSLEAFERDVLHHDEEQ